MIKKLKSRAGLTLTEMLVTLLILSMFSVACLIGITTAFRARQDNIKSNDADILASMVTQLITDELRFSENAKIVSFPDTDDNGIQYRSHASGYNDVTIHLKDDGKGGRLYMTLNGTTLPDQMMLNDAAYSTFPLCLDNLTFEQDGNGNICVKFDVCDNDGKQIAHEEFYVKPLNTDMKPAESGESDPT